MRKQLAGEVIEMADGKHQTATILDFARNAGARAASAGGMSVSERIEALRWADAARDFGVRQVQFHQPEPGDDPAVGPFLLIYRADDLWAAWGIARQLRGYELWRPSCGSTVGLYDTIGMALAAIQSAA